MISTNQFRKGLKIEINGEPFNIVGFQHVKPGKGNAFVRTRLKSMTSGNVLEKTFKSGEKVEKPDLDERDTEFLYQQGEDYTFMDMENYEQFTILESDLGDAVKFLKDNTKAALVFYKGKAIDIELPIFINLKIKQTDPGVRGDTVSGATKPATLETGAVVQVPLFIEEGENIKIDTRTGTYVERVKK